MRTVLTLSTYRYASPRSGGAKRLYEIASAYRRAGLNVHSLVVRDAAANDGSLPADIEITLPGAPEARTFMGMYIPEITDFLTALHLEAHADQFRLPENVAQELALIHLEQPWLWPLAEKLSSNVGGRRVPVIYSSANIECDLKTEILESLDVSCPPQLYASIKNLEVKAALGADVVAAVTNTDAARLRGFGARNVTLAQNGVAKASCSPEVLDRWRARLPSAPWALYVASGYRPNYSDFETVFGNNLGCIPPDSRLVVAGGAGEPLLQLLSRGMWRTLNISRLLILGELDEEDLSAVRQLASAYILPLKRGGGSSLKTAEAIHSGKPVVASPAAMRGFDEWTSSPHVLVASDPTDFGRLTREALTRPLPRCDSVNSRPLKELEWDQTLVSLMNGARELIQQ